MYIYIHMCVCVCVYIYIYVCVYLCQCVLHTSLHGVVSRKTFVFTVTIMRNPNLAEICRFLRLPSKLWCLIFSLSRPPAVFTVCSCYEAARHPLRRLPVFLSFSVLKNVIAQRANCQDRRDR